MSALESFLRSFADFSKIEVTTVLGCPVNCIYCPQAQIIKEGKGREKILHLKDFKKAINNIDIPLLIGWTGYSEPCLSKDLEGMVNYVTNKGFPQYISTTLAGNNDSVEFVIKSKDFNRFILHLPDNSGLMKGLKVDESYVRKVKYFLDQKYKDGLSSKVDICCFGADLHPSIKDIVLSACEDRGIAKCSYSVTDKIYTRAGGIDLERINTLGLEVGESSIPKQKGSFYCKKQKMNSPVLLPDGSLNICSFDYGLRNTYGNLYEEKYSNIRKAWLQSIYSDFNKGRLSPCSECEYYASY